MTYFGFLFYFVFVPILILLILIFRDKSDKFNTSQFQMRLVWRIILLHIVFALVYTTPWDNYLVATGVWSYNPVLVSGIVFGWVPLEEYIFFVAETLLSSLWWLYLVRTGINGSENIELDNVSLGAETSRNSVNVRLFAFGGLFFVWIIFSLLFFIDWKPGTYLSIILFWALPAIFPQFLFGADILWHHRKLLFLTIFPVGLYLSLIDIIALKATTWSISPAQTTGILFFGILPLEEVLFFCITNVLIAFGMTLMLSNRSQQRLSGWRVRGYKGLP